MKATLKILILDDEPEARELLLHLLSEEKEVVITGLAANADEALQLMKDNQPDLILLDISMPGKDGFQFIELAHGEGYDPGIIFVTARDDHAIRAIRKAVFDYLLKPIRKEELLGAIERFRNRYRDDGKKDLQKLLQHLNEKGPDKIKFSNRSGYVLVRPGDVVYCKAEGNHTHIRLADGRMEMTTQNLGAVETSLDEAHFFRVSRSYLINLRFLSRVERKGSYCVLEYGGRSYTVRIPSKKIRTLESRFA